MTWVWILAGIAAAAVLVLLVYWQLIVAEGAYLGPRVVAWTYDLVARRYDAIKQFDPREESWFVASPLFQRLGGVEHPLVLDVATGTGRVPLGLLRDRFAGQVVGLDLSLGMLRQAVYRLRPYRDQVGLVWQDASHLPFDDGTFDAVTSLESLEFLPRPLEALAEMVRVLAPAGVLMVTNRVGREARLLPGRILSRPAFLQALASHDLQEMEVRHWQIQYDLVIARKKGQPASAGHGGVDWSSLLRCPGCRRPLQVAPTALSCPACGRVFPIHEGIVHVASRKAATG